MIPLQMLTVEEKHLWIPVSVYLQDGCIKSKPVITPYQAHA